MRRSLYVWFSLKIICSSIKARIQRISTDARQYKISINFRHIFEAHKLPKTKRAPLWFWSTLSDWLTTAVIAWFCHKL